MGRGHEEGSLRNTAEGTQQHFTMGKKSKKQLTAADLEADGGAFAAVYGFTHMLGEKAENDYNMAVFGEHGHQRRNRLWLPGAPQTASCNQYRWVEGVLADPE